MQTSSAAPATLEHVGRLQWIRADVEQNLTSARQELESFIANPSLADSMERAVALLREVQGAMSMVELHGVARLIEEMAGLGAALSSLDRKGKAAGAALLMRGLAQLPSYMEYVATGHPDAPVLLLPLMNELRGARGLGGLTPVHVFAPDLWVPIPQLVAAESLAEDELIKQAKQYRLLFQKGLIGWLKGAPPREGAGLVAAVIHRLVQLVGNTEARRLWWVAMGLSGALRLGELEASDSVKRMLSGLDRQLKRMVDEGSSALDRRPPENLLKALLYLCASASKTTGPMQQIREVFRLDSFLVNPASREAAQQSLKGPNLEALQRVSDGLREDLDWVMDALDTLVRSADMPRDGFASLAAPLKRIGTVFGMLGLESTQAKSTRLIEAIEGLSATDIGNDEVLLPVAAGLLELDTTLDLLRTQGLEHTLAVYRRAENLALADSDVDLGALESLSLLEAVTSEARSDLSLVKEAITTFIAEPDHFDVLEDVPAKVQAVEGSAAMLSLDKARELLHDWLEYFTRKFFEQRSLPDAQTLDALAETVVSLEYYLDGVADGRADAQATLGRAEQAVDYLRSVLPPKEPEPETQTRST